jgi:hypothetical protein
VPAHRPADLPRSLRRAAARPAGPRGRRPSARLLEAARLGLLTRGNTTPGSVGRRAVDAAAYDRRLAAAERRARERGRAAPSARQAAGHDVRRRRISALVEGAGLVVIDVGLSDSRKVGRHLDLAGALVGGQISAAAFRARLRAWRSLDVRVTGGDLPPGTYRLMSGPEDVEAAMSEALDGGTEIVVYEVVP